MNTKICTECRQEKALTEFHRDRSHGRNGYKSKCKACRHEARVPGRHQKYTPPAAAIPVRSPEEERASAARRGALKILVDRHEREFRQLVANEMSRLDVPKHWVRVS